MEPYEAALFEEFERDCDRYCTYLERLEQQSIMYCRTQREEMTNERERMAVEQ
jgi:hypothetical protein